MIAVDWLAIALFAALMLALTAAAVLTPASDLDELCGEPMPGDRLDGPRCDLPVGHDGNHVAGDRFSWRQW